MAAGSNSRSRFWLIIFCCCVHIMRYRTCTKTFLSELYVYLVDQMHISLNKTLNVEDQSPVPEPLTDSAQLKHFAREAEVNENFDLAAKYYKERIARDRKDPDNWIDYGTFCLYINDLTKAEECLKECISLDQRHRDGLLLYGVVCSMLEKNDVAETFFEAATTFYPDDMLCWTMLGLYYEGLGNEIGTEMALMEANKINKNMAIAEANATREAEEQKKKEELELLRGDVTAEEGDAAPSGEQDGAAPTPHVPTEEAAETQHRDVTTAAEPAGHKIAATPTSAASSELKNKGKKEERKSSPSRSKSGENNVRKAGKGNRSHRGRSPVQEAVLEEEATPTRETTPIPEQTIYMLAIEWMMEAKAIPFTERALALHLTDQYGGPSAEYYIALARLRLQRHLLSEAEESLSEALQLDHQNPDAWAIMGHVKYLQGDTSNARDCYERTLSFVADASEMHSIYLRLASIYLQENRFQEAKHSFLMACKRTPSCVSWLGVGISCYRLGEMSEAEDALGEANILNNMDPEVWAYLSLVCLKTGRQFEAEQSFKYAIKLELDDEHLLTEINTLQEELGFGNPSF